MRRREDERALGLIRAAAAVLLPVSGGAGAIVIVRWNAEMATEARLSRIPFIIQGNRLRKCPEGTGQGYALTRRSLR